MNLLTHHHRINILVALLLATLAVLVTGCDDRPRRVPIAGQVMIDGQPIEHGNISFVPKEGRSSSGKIGESGRFDLTCYEQGDGAIQGTHRVQVAARQIDGNGKLVWLAPKSYADFRTSGLTYDVNNADDSVVIELSWDGEQQPSETTN